MSNGLLGTESQAPVTGNTESTRPENRAFYPALDGLRAVAFLMVFVWHYTSYPWCWAGVNIFFVLSGFLITGILYDTRNDLHRARKFYIRRTLRIFPLYYGVLLVFVLAWPVAHWHWNKVWIVWPLYLGNLVNLFWAPPGSTNREIADFIARTQQYGHVFQFNLGHFWSLCVEEQFYLVWPWVVFWISERKALMRFCLIATAACLIARIVGQHMLPLWMLNQGVIEHVTFFRLDDLFVGGLIALIIRGPLRAAAFRTARLCAPVLLLAIIVWVIHIASLRMKWSQYPYPPHTFTWGFTVIQVFTGLLLLAIIPADSRLARMFAIKPLRWAGRLSYGAYVFHDIFHNTYLRVLHRLGSQSKLLNIFFSLVCTYALAWLSFRFFETPFLNLKERWAR